MLYLGNGAREVKVGEEGAERSMQIFPDFSDPLQFYYLPNFPHVAKMPDGSAAIRLLVFRENLEEIDDDDEQAVAFLSLDVDVSWEPDLIEQARGKLRLEENLSDKPRLTPIFYREGSVKLMLLDAVTPEEGERPDADASTQFVTKILGAGSPSLYGDNRAIFQAMLPKKGAAALSGAMEGVTPIGVVYSLTFAGLQPAFNIRARVEWTKVMDHFSEQEHLDLLFYEKDVQKSIDTLVEDKVIQIESTIEGVGAEAMQAEHDKVMDQVRQLIFDKFFEATFEREDAAGQSTADDVVNTLTHIHQNALTLGIGYTYRRKEVKIEELRTLELDYSVRRATERQIYPQAHMHNVLSTSGMTLDQLVTVVDGSDEVWRTLPFRVTAAASWETDGIAGITVEIEYEDESGGARQWSTHLNKDKASDEHRAWMDRTSGTGFRYRYQVVFSGDNAVPGPHPILSSGEWRERDGTSLDINPRELYRVDNLEVAAINGFPFERWPAVQAMIRYNSVAEEFEFRDDDVLKSDHLAFSTSYRCGIGELDGREISLSYVGATGERFDTGWMPMPQTEWIVEDPHQTELTVRAVVAGDRTKISNLVVDLEYEDQENGIQESAALMFDPETVTQPQSWVVHLADPAKRRYRYRMTLILIDGEFLQTGWISTDAPTLPVGELYVRQLAVQMQSTELEPGIDHVEVKLEYTDEANSVHELKEFILGPKAKAEWTIQLQDASKRDYKATMKWMRDDGFSTTVGPLSHNETLLVVPGAPPEGS